MAAKKKIFTGDTFPIEVNVVDDDGFDAIPLDATVTVGLVANRKSRDLLAGPWTASQATPGANWPIGKVVVTVNGVDTEGIDPQSALVEVQVVTASSKITYQTKNWVTITKGSLP